MKTTCLVGTLLFLGATVASAQDPAARGGLSLSQILAQLPEVVTQGETTRLPAGTLELRVVDEAGRGLPGKTVLLGTIVAGKRARQAHVTDASGRVRLDGLETSGIAYRVIVPRDGAKYSSTPFRLGASQGYEVTTRYLPTNGKRRSVLQLSASTVIELRETRARISTQLSLLNFSSATYLFPDEGLSLGLPEAATGFESQPGMTDQRLEASPEGGARVFGSLAPGLATLSFVYELAVRGSELQFSQALPFAVINHDVAVPVLSGLRLDVGGFEPAVFHENAGERFLVARLQRTPDAPPIARLRISLSGIPGPGPARLVAVGLALLILLIGGVLALRPVDTAARLATLRERQRDTLLREARALEHLRQSGEVGESFYARQRQRILTELATLLARQPKPRDASPRTGSDVNPQV